MKRCLCVLSIVLTSHAAIAGEQPFSASWYFWSLGLNVYSQNTYPSNFTGVAGSRTAMPLIATRGPGLHARSNGPERTWAFNLPAYKTLTQSIAADGYIEVKVGPSDSRYMTVLTEIALLASAGKQPITVGLFSSELGFEPQHQIGKDRIISSTASDHPSLIALDEIPEKYSPALVTYRLYFASTTTNWFALGGSTELSTNNAGLVIRGKAVDAAQESAGLYLSTVVGVWMCAASLCIRRRKRR